MIALPDVNVLIALAWPSHVHHEAAHTWLAGLADGQWATCPLTQSAFVRVSSNRAVIPAARSPREAVQALEMMLAHPRHVFLRDEVSIADRRWVAVDKLVGHQQIADAHVLAVALTNRAQLVTLDRRMATLVPDHIKPDVAVAVLG